MRVVSSIVAILVLAGCAVDGPSQQNEYPPPVQQITTTQVAVGQTITATSRDGTFGVHFGPGSFAEPVSVQINQGNSSPASAVTLSKSYAITVTPVTATLQQSVDISFVVAPDVVTAHGGAGNLRVGHGEILGQAWHEALPGTYDSTLGRFTASTSSFSYFLVFDLNGYSYCACDVGPGCQLGCEFCDGDCSEPACTQDSECDSSCCLAGVCAPASYCDEPVSCFEHAECDSLCCVDAVCVPSSYCDEPGDCFEDAECDSYCCVEGVCQPSNVCGAETCTYDAQCDTNCCADGLCAPADTCINYCSHDIECDTECCAEGVCAPADYCVEYCSYDYECATECCFDGVCVSSEMCAPPTCTYDYNCDSGCCVDSLCVDASYCVECVDGSLRCSDNWLEECVGGAWGAYVEDCGVESLTCVQVNDTWAECQAATGCGLDEWQCNDGGCIPEVYRCDRYSEGADCVDGSDEDPYCPLCSVREDCPVGDTWACDTITGSCYQPG